MITTSKIELTDAMLEKAKLDWIHLPVAIIAAIMLIVQLLYVLITFKVDYLSRVDFMCMLFMVIPIAYFIYLQRMYAKLKIDKENGYAKLLSGTVTSKKIIVRGTGNSRSRLFTLYCSDEKIIVNKSFYNRCQIGDFVCLGTLPLSAIIVYEHINEE